MKGNPFGNEIALKNSALHWPNGTDLIPADDAAQGGSFLHEAHAAFRDIVLQEGFSCIGAKAAFHAQAYGFAVYSKLGSIDSNTGLCRDLCHFTQSGVAKQNEFATFVSVFRGPLLLDEVQFEELLWRQLHDLHEASRKHFGWDGSVSSNPENPEFSFSFAGRAFYVLGMHPRSSRIARQFPWPALAFNPHEQFERLRTEGKWKRMQRSIRARELVLQGSINPMLNDFGEKSEARQYSGRAVSDDWTPPGSGGKCPFH